jgi:Tol biopolymer transport system component
MLSPDGRWLAYMSNESGEYHVYVDAFPRKGSKRRVSTEPAGYPAWARNGSALFFIGIKEERPLPLMLAAYRARGERFVPDKPRVWWTSLAHFATARGYDPAPDRKRVVAITAADLSQVSHDRVVFLLNFFDELKRRAPVTAN